jgi:hypothetical protein
MQTAVLYAYSPLVVELPVHALRTLYWPRTDVDVRATVHQLTLYVHLHTNAFHSGGSVIHKMTVEMEVMNISHVPSLDVYQANSNVTRILVYIHHSCVTDKLNVTMVLMKEIVIR